MTVMAFIIFGDQVPPPMWISGAQLCSSFFWGDQRADFKDIEATVVTSLNIFVGEIDKDHFNDPRSRPRCGLTVPSCVHYFLEMSFQ